MENNILIDTLIFNEGLEVNYEKIFGMFDSDHYQECCESHELDFSDSKKAFEEVDRRFNKIEKIEIKGTPGMGITLFFYEDKNEENDRVGIFIPGRGCNNGYYGSNIDLIVTFSNGSQKTYDISEYQNIE